jgi:hypothetical protein
MGVGFATYAISAYHYYSYEFEMWGNPIAGHMWVTLCNEYIMIL